MGGNHLDVALILMSHFCSKSSWRDQTRTTQFRGGYCAFSAAFSMNQLMATVLLAQI